MGNIVQSGGARSRAEIQADLTEAMRNEPKNQSRIAELQSELENSEPDKNASDNGGENNNSAVAEPNNSGSNNGGSNNGGSSNSGSNSNSTVAQPNDNNGGSSNSGSSNVGSNSNSTVAQPNDNGGSDNSGSNNSGSSNGGSTIAQPDSNNRETINTQETDPCDQKKKLEKCKELATPKPDLEKIKAAPSWSLSNWLFQIFDTDYWQESEQEECKAILENPPEINSTINCPNNNDRGLNNVSLPNFSEDNSEAGVPENAENNRGLSDVPVPTFPNNRKGGARTTHKNRVARRRTRKTAEREAAV